jgi:hypothetical protein
MVLTLTDLFLNLPILTVSPTLIGSLTFSFIVFSINSRSLPIFVLTSGVPANL